jgi:hypothetical protein
VTYYGGVQKREKLILTLFWPISAGFCIPKYAGNLTFGAITFFFVGIFRPARAQKLRGPGEINRRKISQSDVLWRGRNTGKFGFQPIPAKHYHKGRGRGGGGGGWCLPSGGFSTITFSYLKIFNFCLNQKSSFTVGELLVCGTTG